MFFWSLFLKPHFKKCISRQKRHFGRFWQLLTYFSALSKMHVFCLWIVKQTPFKKCSSCFSFFEFWNKHLFKNVLHIFFFDPRVDCVAGNSWWRILTMRRVARTWSSSPVQSPRFALYYFWIYIKKVETLVRTELHTIHTSHEKTWEI